jgi:hypothetical protein
MEYLGILLEYLGITLIEYLLMEYLRNTYGLSSNLGN